MVHGLEHLDAEPVATLATVRPDGLPHLVPITFAVVGDVVVWAVDHKPKTTRRLRRIAHLERDPRVTLLVSHYDDDWRALWWVRIEGTCRQIVDDELQTRARRALQEKYAQYRARAPEGPYFAVNVQRTVHWQATDRG